jgi:hypothetical protein
LAISADSIGHPVFKESAKIVFSATNGPKPVSNRPPGIQKRFPVKANGEVLVTIARILVKVRQCRHTQIHQTAIGTPVRFPALICSNTASIWDPKIHGDNRWRRFIGSKTMIVTLLL